MKAWSSALVSLINGGVFFNGLATPGEPFVPWDCYFITLTTGLVLAYTNANFPIAVPNNTIFDAPAIYGSGNVWFSGLAFQPFGIDSQGHRATGHWKVGLDSDQWQVEFSPRPFDLITGTPYPDTIGSEPWLSAVRAGVLANADVIIGRAYFSSMPSYYPSSASWIGPTGSGLGAVPVGIGIIQRGSIGPITMTGDSATITINDYKALLNMQMPRNLYTPSCVNVFGDARCGASRAAFTKSGVASAASDQGTIIAQANVPAPGGSNTYSLGVIKFTSGANNGYSQLVNTWDGGVTFVLLHPLPYSVAPGDTFNVTAGCNRSVASCTAFFGSPTFQQHFRGDPYVPFPEAATL